MSTAEQVPNAVKIYCLNRAHARSSSCCTSTFIKFFNFKINFRTEATQMNNFVNQRQPGVLWGGKSRVRGEVRSTYQSVATMS